MKKNEDTKSVKQKKDKKTDFIFNPKQIPTASGCYLFYDAKGTLLYVGKAKNLRKRVKSYFQQTKKSVKTTLMVSKITRIETRITNSEIESLILENNLIKEFRPRFNILLRDDKSFLYLRITKEDFPRLEITRRIVQDGSFYVGPKTSAKSFRKTIAFCQKVFKIRDCRLKMTRDKTTQKLTILKNPEKRKLPCMDYHIKKCSGPCDGSISLEAYQADISAMKKFLRGNTSGVVKSLKAKMMRFAETQNFEAAGKIRDLIQSIEISTEKQTVQLDAHFEADFVHFYRQKNTAYLIRVLFRNGKFLDQNTVTFSAPSIATDSEILEKFLIQFYEKVDQLPKTIYLPTELENEDIVMDFFHHLETDQTTPKTTFFVPQKGDKKKILEMAYKNVRNTAKKAAIETMSQAENFSKALPQLAKALSLQNPPKRIECYDISHYSGAFPVASQVVFIDGKPKTSEYRRYHIKSLPEGKIDDFASMEEVLKRRFKGFFDDKKETKFLKHIPDLVVIDGGKGQLSTVMKVFRELTTEDLCLSSEEVVEGKVEQENSSERKGKNNDTIDTKCYFDPKKQIISLAKREEQVFRPGSSDPLELNWNDPALKLLQRVRDEAHRFAIGFNRSLRKKNLTKSVLDEVPGIGGVSKKKLMKTFESVSGIRKASDEALLKIINKNQLTSIRKFL